MNKKDKWIEEGWYDCCSARPIVSYSLYDSEGDWLYSVSDVRYIPMYYYLKEDPSKTYKDYGEELENGTLPDYSHLYEVVSSIDYSWY